MMFQGMKYVYEVYKESSFSKAAKNLMIAQPSLSACVKKEEERLGVQLFNRNTSPIQLTEPGKEYIKSVERIMDIQNSFQNYINDYNGLVIGNLAIGTNNIYAAFLFPKILAYFRKLYPSITLTLTEGRSCAELEDKLLNGSLDIAIDNFKINEEIFNYHHLFNEVILLAVPKEFKINEKYENFQLSSDDLWRSTYSFNEIPTISLEPFANLPFLLLKEGTDTRMRLDSAFSKYNIVPNIILEPDQTSTAYLSACTGLGATFVTNTMAARFHISNPLIFYHIDAIELQRKVNVCIKKNHYVTKVMQQFLELADEMFSNHLL